MKTCKKSKDYKKLQKLLDDGWCVICYIDDGDPTEICFARKTEDDVYDFGSLGMQFFIPEYFVENCETENIAFMEPEDNDIELETEVYRVNHIGTPTATIIIPDKDKKLWPGDKVKVTIKKL